MADKLIIWKLQIVDAWMIETWYFKERSSAMKELYLHVWHSWHDQFNEPIPDDHEEAISEYFCENECESYTLNDIEVLGESEE